MTAKRVRVVRCLRSVLRQDIASTSDGELLGRFVRDRDEAAFEALVRRHGPMVLGVCRRVLRDPHDAEDAFQATFLVLLRRASSVRPPHLVGNWLYGVAYRTALHARKAAAKRRAKEAQIEPRQETAREDWAELLPLLDQEVSRLPNRYRVVLVLCDLDGRTRREAARALGWAEGTVASRLARARALLKKRLTRYGVAIPAVAFITPASPTAVPVELLTATVQTTWRQVGFIPVTVVGLAEGVLKSMALAKLKLGLVVATTVVALGIGASGFAFLPTRSTEHEPAQGRVLPPAQVAREAPATVLSEKQLRKELERLREDYEDLKIENVSLQKEVAELRRALSAKEGERLRLEIRARVLQETVDRLQQPNKKPVANPGLQGTVTQATPQEGLAILSIGSDHGVQKGQVLHVYRLDPKPVYLGALKVVAVNRQSAVGQTQPGKEIKPGDHVISNLPPQ